MNKNFQHAYKTFRGIVKRNKWIFSLHRHLTDKDYQREKERMATCTAKSKEQIKKEMEDYSRYWGCQADDYIRYGLFDKDLSMDEILDYVPMQYYYCQYQDKMFKGVDLYQVDDKIYEYQLFAQKGIPQPEIIAVIRNNRLMTLDEHPMTFNVLKDLTKEGERLFLKPTDGDCGTGIVVVKKENDNFLMKGQTVNGLGNLPLSANSVYIVQRGLVQRDDFAAINESSLNTLRTIVRYENGKAIIGAMLLRIGRKGSEVDNSGQGGVSVEVNMSDGSLGEYAGREHGGGRFAQHPDTGVVFKNVKFRDWDKVMEQCQDIVSRITDYKTIGWDLAVGEDRVYAIEMNMGWGIEHAQTIAGGFRRKMGIYPES